MGREKRQRGDLAVAIKQEEDLVADQSEQQPKRQRQEAQRGASGDTSSAPPVRDQQAEQQQQQQHKQQPKQEQLKQEHSQHQQQEGQASATTQPEPGEGEPSTPRGAAHGGSPPTTPAKFAAALVPGADPTTAAARAIDDAASAVMASLTLRGRVAEGDELVALYLVTRALRSTDQQLACEAAEALVTLVTSAVDRQPAVLSGLVIASTAATNGAIAPLVAMMARGSAAAAGCAAAALVFLHQVAQKSQLAAAVDVPGLIMQEEGAVAALLRTVDLGIGAGAAGDTTGPLCALSLLVKAQYVGRPTSSNVVRIADALAGSVPILIQALERGSAQVASLALAVLCRATGSKRAVTALATGPAVAAVARWLTAGSAGVQTSALSMLLIMYAETPAVAALFERQGVLEAMAAAGFGSSDDNVRELARDLLTSVAKTEERRGAVASAVAAALHACPSGEEGAELRQRLRAFLAARPFSMQPFMIDALLRSAAEAARLRAEVAALEAMPVNTRAAIVELASAVRGGN